ncbi:MAG: NIPSNAP family protein [Acidiferrobacterales bacterium]|nr:NIPSNAP family protein [Acidiferrobacterales bacterium]
MIYELRTHTIRPGSEQHVVDAGKRIKEIRGDSCGTLEGSWTPSTGQLNQINILWSYPDRNERQRLRKDLMKNERWTNGYLPMISEYVSRFELKILDPIAPFHPPATEGNIYLLRSFQTLPGQVWKWANMFREILPVREKYSKNVGAWISDANIPDEVYLMYAYPSIDAITQCARNMAADPEWNSFIEESSKILRNRHLTVLSPTPSSPMR